MRDLVKFLCLFLIIALPLVSYSEKIDKDITSSELELELKPETVGSVTDSDVAQREANSIKSLTEAELEALAKNAQKFEFQAEVSELMNLIINSLYSNKEIFLRELISNASDALDKIRFASLSDPNALGEGETAKLEIKLQADKGNKVLHIVDRGIGMTKQDLINNLGTIARSGTKEFIKKVTQKEGGMNLIGQFGVGFYSVFLVADDVYVTTKHNDDKQYIWHSTANRSYSIVEDPAGNTLGRGTRISIKLKEDALDFLEETTLEKLVEKYSEFINFPISLYTTREEEKEVPVDSEEEVEAEKETETSEEEESDSDEEEESEEEEKEKPKTKKIKEVVNEWKLLNKNKPIWTRNPKEITPEEYNDFYKTFSKDYSVPLAYTHFTGEGDVDFRAILYVPGTAPHDQYSTNKLEKSRNVKLYVKRVFITDNFDDVMPKYLSFIKGVVDSDDLPLNVSREILQQNKILEVIKKKLVRKAISMFQELSQDTTEIGKAKWKEFYQTWSVSIKLGCIEDRLNKARLSKLLRFHSSKSNEMTSLEDYVSRMKEGQEDIYYLAGESREIVENSPLVEKLIKKGYEVLFMVDAIDEYVTQHLEKFDGKYKLTNIAKEGLNLPGDDKEKEKEIADEFSQLTEFIKNQLPSKLEKVSVSNRLGSAPAALFATKWGHSANLERIFKAQALSDPKVAAQYRNLKKVLEINPKHPIIKELNSRITDGDTSESTKEIVDLLYETAVISSGYTMDDPNLFAGKLHRVIKQQLGLDPNVEVEEEESVAEEESAKEETVSVGEKDEL